MKRLSALLPSMCAFALVAQPSLPSFNATDTVTIPCPQDPGVNILTYPGWEAYQTLDDTWWGPHDPAICIDLAHIVGNWVYPRIAVDQIDASRPVFIRALYDDNNVLPLLTNNQYAIWIEAYWTGQFDVGPCPGGPCTALFAGVRIPDAAGTGTDMRWYQAAYDDQSSLFPLELCLPTEKFAQNELREFIVSLKPTSPTPGSYLTGFYNEVLDMDAMGTLVRLTGANLADFQLAQFYYQFASGWENFLVMHDNMIYPDADNVFYLDIPAVPNTSTPDPVTVSLEPYTGFNFQPFTQLRGGLLEGSSEDRHPLTIVNNGADLCLGWNIVEIIVGPADRFVHQSGHVSFDGQNACFQFQSGSTLEIAANSRWDYGENGRGLLLLIEGSELRIDPGAQLVMHGKMIIKEPAGATEHKDMHVRLTDGARLEFAPGSQLINDWSVDGRMKLVVTLDGGSIDIGGLAPQDREKVVVIELPEEEWTGMTILGNPFEAELRLSCSSRQATLVGIRMIDAAGRVAYQGQATAVPGNNDFRIPLPGLRPGPYLVQTRIGTRAEVHRVVKQ